jgi:hypothetical protein
MRAIPPSYRFLALVLAVAVASIAVMTACGGSASPPTVVPTPVPTPTPAPTPTPDPNVPPEGSGCGQPYPPMITRFSVKIHLKDKDWWTIDSTPLVGPNGDYCFSIGFTDGRTICPVRPEGAPDREACELWRTGKAKDTGQPGPTWTFRDPDTGQESYCTNTEDAPCLPYEGRVFSVKAIKGGLYKACSEAGACGQVDVDRNR